MSTNKSKQPKAAHTPQPEKRPRTGATLPVSDKTPRAHGPALRHEEKPSWRLALLDSGGPWRWQNISSPDLQRILPRLQQFETMTWGEILGKSGDKHHSIDVHRLSKTAQDRLREIRLDDIDDVISLRVTGQERIFGVRFGSVLRLLWWDPLHEVCPSQKKHT